MNEMIDILSRFMSKHPRNVLTHRERIFLAAMFNRMNRDVVWQVLATCASEKFCSDLKEHIKSERS